MSRWGGALTREEADCMVASGIRLAAIGSGWEGTGGGGEWAREQGQMAHDAGMLVDGYVYLYLDKDVRQQVRNAKAALNTVPIRMWWLDMEDTESPHLSVEQRVAALDAAIEELGAVVYGIYSARWWWNQYMAGVTKYSHLPLWNANYDNDPDEDALPFGGWEHSAIEQYGGTQEVCGQSVDINYAKNLDRLDQEADMGMTPQEKADFDSLKAQVADLNKAVSQRFDLLRVASGTDDQGFAAMQAAHAKVVA